MNEELSARLRQSFEEAGAKVDVDDGFLDRYSIDFTVTRFTGVHAHVNLGIHVTSNRDDLEQLERFVQGARRGVVLKSLYLEVPEEALENGAMLPAYGACLAYLFDRRHHQGRTVGIRIFEDCSYQHFDLEETIQRLQRMADDADLAIGEELEGRIIAYFTDKGFGFIQTDDERKYFFHIANIVDDELRGRLPTYVPGEVIPVDFQYGGNDGKKYPKAINVALL